MAENGITQLVLNDQPEVGGYDNDGFHSSDKPKKGMTTTTLLNGEDDPNVRTTENGHIPVTTPIVSCASNNVVVLANGHSVDNDLNDTSVIINGHSSDQDENVNLNCNSTDKELSKCPLDTKLRHYVPADSDGKMLNSDDTRIPIPDDAVINFNTGRIRLSKSAANSPNFKELCDENDCEKEKIPLQDFSTPVEEDNAKAIEAGQDVHHNGHGPDDHQYNEVGDVILTTDALQNEKMQQSNGTGKFEEYFIPVNTHKKYLRGEKLYLTKDSPKLCQNWRRCIICGLIAIVIAVAILVGVLAATGILLAESNNKSTRHESNELPGSASISVAGRHSRPPTPSKVPQPLLTTVDVPVSTTTKQPVVTEASSQIPLKVSSIVPPLQRNGSQSRTIVPNALVGEFTIVDVVFTDDLNDNRSQAYQSLARHIETELRGLIKRHGGESEIIRVLKFSPGSVAVRYVVVWRNPRHLILAKDAYKIMKAYIESGSNIFLTHTIDTNSLNFTDVVDECAIQNGECSYNCTWSYLTLRKTCLCEENMELAEDEKTCVIKPTTTITVPVTSSTELTHTEPMLTELTTNEASTPQAPTIPAIESETTVTNLIEETTTQKMEESNNTTTSSVSTITHLDITTPSVSLVENKTIILPMTTTESAASEIYTSSTTEAPQGSSETITHDHRHEMHHTTQVPETTFQVLNESITQPSTSSEGSSTFVVINDENKSSTEFQGINYTSTTITNISDGSESTTISYDKDNMGSTNIHSNTDILLNLTTEASTSLGREISETTTTNPTLSTLNIGTSRLGIDVTPDMVDLKPAYTTSSTTNPITDVSDISDETTTIINPGIPVIRSDNSTNDTSDTQETEPSTQSFEISTVTLLHDTSTTLTLNSTEIATEPSSLSVTTPSIKINVSSSEVDSEPQSVSETTTEPPLTFEPGTEPPVTFEPDNEPPSSSKTTAEPSPLFEASTGSSIPFETTIKSLPTFEPNTVLPSSLETTAEPMLSSEQSTGPPLPFETTKEPPPTSELSTGSLLPFETSTKLSLTSYSSTEPPPSFVTTAEPPSSSGTTTSSEMNVKSSPPSEGSTETSPFFETTVGPLTTLQATSSTPIIKVVLPETTSVTPKDILTTAGETSTELKITTEPQSLTAKMETEPTPSAVDTKTESYIPEKDIGTIISFTSSPSAVENTNSTLTLNETGSISVEETTEGQNHFTTGEFQSTSESSSIIYINTENTSESSYSTPAFSLNETITNVDISDQISTVNHTSEVESDNATSTSIFSKSTPVNINISEDFPTSVSNDSTTIATATEISLSTLATMFIENVTTSIVPVITDEETTPVPSTSTTNMVTGIANNDNSITSSSVVNDSLVTTTEPTIVVLPTNLENFTISTVGPTTSTASQPSSVTNIVNETDNATDNMTTSTSDAEFDSITLNETSTDDIMQHITDNTVAEIENGTSASVNATNFEEDFQKENTTTIAVVGPEVMGPNDTTTVAVQTELTAPPNDQLNITITTRDESTTLSGQFDVMTTTETALTTDQPEGFTTIYPMNYELGSSSTLEDYDMYNSTLNDTILNVTATEMICREDQFLCDDLNACLNNTVICDGIADCPDGFDESNCTDSCYFNFKCTNTSMCVTNNVRCDSIWDCEDGSDEDDCRPKECAKHEVMCLDGSVCIKPVHICDNLYNCKDRSDEVGCVERTTCESGGRFFCNDGLCIPWALKCDGEYDCKDREDEGNCTCLEDEFKCNDGKCLKNSMRCDGDKDCINGEDELGCVKVDSQNMVIAYETYSMRWAMLCGEDWTLDDGQYLCQELGYGHVLSVEKHHVSFNGTWMAMKRGENLTASSLWTKRVGFAESCSSNFAASVECQSFECGNYSGLLHRRRRRQIEPSSPSNQWPFIAYVSARPAFKANKGCLAEILTPIWMITSAECLLSIGKDIHNGSIWYVRTNVANVVDKESSQNHDVQKIILHHHSSKYRSLALRDYDVAMIRLNHALVFRENKIGAICLPEEQVPSGITCFTGVFGTEGKPRGTPPVSLSINSLALMLLDRDFCNKEEHFNGTVNQRMLCTKSSDSQTICDNDEGTPLMCLSGPNKWYLAGMLTYQRYCGIYSWHPNIYSNLHSMKKDIDQITGQKQYGVPYDSNMYIILPPTTIGPTETTTITVTTVQTTPMTTVETAPETTFEAIVTTPSVPDLLRSDNLGKFTEMNATDGSDNATDFGNVTTVSYNLNDFDEHQFDNSSDSHNITIDTTDKSKVVLLVTTISNITMVDSTTLSSVEILNSTNVTSLDQPPYIEMLDDNSTFPDAYNNYTSQSDLIQNVTTSSSNMELYSTTTASESQTNDLNAYTSTFQSETGSTESVLPTELVTEMPANGSGHMSMSEKNMSITDVPSSSSRAEYLGYRSLEMAYNTTYEPSISDEFVTQYTSTTVPPPLSSNSSFEDTDTVMLSDAVHSLNNQSAQLLEMITMTEKATSTEIPDVSTVTEFKHHVSSISTATEITEAVTEIETTTALELTMPTSTLSSIENIENTEISEELSSTTSQAKNDNLYETDSVINDSFTKTILNYAVTTESNLDENTNSSSLSSILPTQSMPVVTTSNVPKIDTTINYETTEIDTTNNYETTKIDTTINYETTKIDTTNNYETTKIDTTNNYETTTPMYSQSEDKSTTATMPVQDSANEFTTLAPKISSTKMASIENETAVFATSTKAFTDDSSIFYNENICGKWKIPLNSSTILSYNDGVSLWPSLGILRREPEQKECLCSILSDRYLLTSLGCLLLRDNLLNPKNWVFINGKFNKSLNISSMVVEEIIGFPEQIAPIMFAENDLAIVKLLEPLAFNEHVSPICLPSQPVGSESFCYSAGWSNGVSEGTQKEFYSLKSVMISPEVCNSSENYYDGSLMDSLMCINYTMENISACQMDIGAPLMCLNKEQWVLQGILPSRVLCDPRKPAVYNKLFDVKTWLRNTIFSIPFTTIGVTTVPPEV